MGKNTGTVTGVDGDGIKGVALSFEDFGTAETDEDGKWRKDGLSGTVKVSPAKDGWAFEPSSRTVSKADSSVNFVATMLEYPLTIQVQGEGTVNQEVLVAAQGTEYEHGTQVQLTAVPATGWRFSHWEGDLDGNENPATIVVDSEKSVTATFSFMSIQSAIDSAQDGDVIMVPPGTYFENLNLKGKNITLTSADPEDPEIVNATIINGGGKDAVIRVESGETGAVITGFTITNGIGGSVNGARYGGGVYVRNSDITLTHSIIRGNSSGYGGGVYINSAMPSTMKYNTVSENSAPYGGGMCFEDGNHTIEGNIVSDNTTGNSGRGGGMHFYFGHHTIKGNTVSENSARLGGGFYLIYGTHTIESNTVSENSAPEGGGFYLEYGTHTIEGNTVSKNSSIYSGGGFKIASGDHTITGNTVSENSAPEGGGFYLDGGTNTISGNTVNKNSATSGGGIYLRNSRACLTMNLFQLNNASNNGGAVWVNALSAIVDDRGYALPRPDLLNDYVDNTPDDVFYE